MKAHAEREFDIFNLLCHDGVQKDAADLPFDDYLLQEAINDRLDRLGRGRLKTDELIQVLAPETTGLDQFTVAHYANRNIDEEPNIFSKRFYSVEDVKKSLPPKIVEILELLNKESLVF
jgi:hypothetical protein